MRIEQISMIISFTALVISTLIALYNMKLQKSFQKFEHGSKEKTKQDLLEVLASLRLIVAKASIGNFCKDLDFKEEKNAVQRFLQSDTWTAMQYSFCISKKVSLLSLRLLIILNSEDRFDLAAFAAVSEKDLHDFIAEDGIVTINKLKEDYSDVLISLYDSKSTDEITKALYETVEKTQTDGDKNFRSFLYYLRDEQNISDPDVDVFIAVSENNVPSLENAIKAGGNIEGTQGDIYKKYDSYLEGFKRNKNHHRVQ